MPQKTHAKSKSNAATVEVEEPPPAKALAKLAKYLEAEDQSMAKFSRWLDVSWITAKKIASGETEPTLEQAFKIREVIGIPIEDWKIESEDA